MTASDIIFYLLSADILIGALLAVTIRHIFRAAIFLLFSLVGIAALYFYLNYQFLAAIQIVVYVGGITVLIIFSIFLTAESGSKMKSPNMVRAAISAITVLFSCALTLWLLVSAHFSSPFNSPADGTNIIEPTVRNIGRQMLSTTEHGYILPFEVVSILLLAAMVGCIVIAIKPKPITESHE